jgi:HD superfamily phosphohydrolase
MLRRFLTIVIIPILLFISSANENKAGDKVPDYIETIHGVVDLSEPLLKELYASAVIQRLKHIHQYGTYNISHPLTGGRTYTRLGHSLGVMKIVQLAKEKGAQISLAQIIAALLHDCSHTVFSHATDPLFMKGFVNGNYHDTVHAHFLKTYGVEAILEKYGLSVEDVLPDCAEFTALEQSAPSLCADRIEYNLHSGYLTDLLTDEDRKAILDDLRFENDVWFFTNPELAQKLAKVSLNDTLNTWGSPSSLLTGIHVSKALKILMDEKAISCEDIQYNLNDDEVWEIMKKSPHPEIQKCVQTILNIDKTYKIVPEGEHDMILKGKFSCIDPLIQVDGKLIKLTDYDPAFAQEFNHIKEIKKKGWPIKFIALSKLDQGSKK